EGLGLEKGAAADPHQVVHAGVGKGNGFRPCNHQGQAPQHVLHAQGGHEGMGQVQTGQQNAVDKAGKRAHRQAGDDQQRHAGDAEVLDQHADGAGAQHAVGTHGQVDAGGNQGAQHAGGDQAVDGSLLEDVHDIADPREFIGHHHAENENQQRQRHQ
ncbi:6,7-dimethyl-8-ribityllumazine synthase, partial [Dysosmobacter welbionis]